MVTLENRKKYVKHEYLPSKLVRQLQERIIDNDKYQHYQTKNNFLQCVAIVYYHQVTKGFGLTNYVPLGQKYWRTVYGGNYYRIIEPLLKEHKILESRNFGSRNIPDKSSNRINKKKEVVTRYRINPVLLDDQHEVIEYIEKGRVLTGLERMWFGNEEFIHKGIADQNFIISIDHKKASNWVDSSAELIFDEFLKTDYIKSIPDGLKVLCYELYEKSGNWTYRTKYRSVKAAKLHAEAINKDLFYFNKNFYIADLNEFKKQRIESLRYHYKHQINQIYTQPVVERQNPKTLRMYSELTNFPSKILQFIILNN